MPARSMCFYNVKQTLCCTLYVGLLVVCNQANALSCTPFWSALSVKI